MDLCSSNPCCSGSTLIFLAHLLLVQLLSFSLAAFLGLLEHQLLVIRTLCWGSSWACRTLSMCTQDSHRDVTWRHRGVPIDHAWIIPRFKFYWNFTSSKYDFLFSEFKLLREAGSDSIKIIHMQTGLVRSILHWYRLLNRVKLLCLCLCVVLVVYKPVRSFPP